MKLLIIGNGIAGVTTARVVTERDPSIDVTIYSEEHFHYYSRPRLVDYVGGRIPEGRLIAYSESWYSDRGIKVLLGKRVTSLSPRDHTIRLEDGTSDTYDCLVLATGASARVPDIPGSDRPGVYTLRFLEDARALRRETRKHQSVLVVGGGLLGLEMAVAFADCEMQVTVAEIFPRLLPRQLDTEGAGILQKRIERRGAYVLTGESCAAIQDSGHRKRVKLSKNGLLDVDMVVISAGAQCNASLAREAGLTCDRGVVVDEHMLTSGPDVFAVGDVAEYARRTWGIIPAALAQARVAAAQIVGDHDTLYEDIVPATTLKVTGIDVTSIGEVNPETPNAKEIRSVDPEEGVYSKFVIRQGRVVGAIFVGSRSRVRAANLLISKRIDVTSCADSLLDVDFDLMALASQPS